MKRKKRGADAAMEIDRLLEEYNPYYDAQINFLLKQMIRDNDRRQYEYKKKIEDIRKDFREGKGQFAEERKKDRRFGAVKPPWEVEEEKRKEERRKLLYGRLGEEREKREAAEEGGESDVVETPDE